MEKYFSLELGTVFWKKKTRNFNTIRHLKNKKKTYLKQRNQLDETMWHVNIKKAYKYKKMSKFKQWKQKM